MLFSKWDYPIFSFDPSLIYLDSAATTLKPKVVIDALSQFYAEQNGTVHRGIYGLAEKATERYERARSSVARFVGAQPAEIIFTSGATESINLIAGGWAAYTLKKGDEIIISDLEHHANILPWLRLAKEQDIILSYIPLLEGNLDYEAYEKMISPRTKLVSITHTSNVLGTKVDLARILKAARAVGAKLLVDASQAVGHGPLDCSALGADFVAFSGHKMMGPTGIGVLYIAHPLHEEVIPTRLGGGMVHSVSFNDFTYAASPHKYEAGTPPIAAAIGLEAAIEYLKEHRFELVDEHERALSRSLIEGLRSIPSIRLLSPSEGHIVSFVSDNAHAHDIAAYLDRKNISVRAGHHCAQPLHTKLGIEASVRVSLSGFSTQVDVDAVLKALETLSL